jgi:hypothetical protein
MKTKDGIETKIGNYYYIENGQVVYLNNTATDAHGNTVFVVTPFFEGETMAVSGDGGRHSEYTARYEHEGKEMLVNDIFDSEPLEKLGARYKEKLKDIHHIGLSVGILTSELSSCEKVKSKLRIDIDGLKKLHEVEHREYKENKEILENLKEDVAEKRQKLSELEDSIADLKNEDVSTLISKTEIMRLNKRDYKLNCLEAGGVDNWEWFDESLKDFRERYPG